MKYGMLDLETLGLRPGCVLISIGLVEFDAGGLGKELYLCPDRAEQLAAGMHKDEVTWLWWEVQSKEARAVFDEPMLPVSDVMAQVNEFVGDNMLLFANGANFDHPLLGAFYHAFEHKPSWPYWNERCHRTLVNLAPQIKRVRPTTAHNALEDAKAQAEHARQVLNYLRAW